MATATMFKKPPGPKISRPQPTVPIGQPMPAMQQIPEPVDMIGRYTGIRHASIGEVAPEAVHVIPTRPGVSGPTGDVPGERPYESGGTFMVGPTIASSTTDPNGANATVTGQIGSSYGDPMQQSTDPNQRLYDARMRQITAQRSALTGQRNVFDLTRGAQPAQQAVYDAQGRLIQAQGQQDAATHQYQLQQQQADQQHLAEIQGINAAHQNGPDIMRAAEAEGAYAAEDKQDRALGVAPPTTVQLPNGANAPAGVRPKIMTQEAYLSDKAQSADAERNAQLKIAQNIVSLMGTNVAEARRAADAAGLTLSEANNMVAQARNEAQYSGLDAQSAGLDVQEAGLRTPGRVVYEDPYTGVGEEVTQAEADRRKQQYQDDLAAGRIPVQIEQARQRRIQENQASALGGLSIGEALSMLGSFTLPDGSTGPTYPAGFREALHAEMIRQGWSELAAKEAIAEAQKPRGGGTIITPPPR